MLLMNYGKYIESFSAFLHEWQSIFSDSSKWAIKWNVSLKKEKKNNLTPVWKYREIKSVQQIEW